MCRMLWENDVPDQKGKGIDKNVNGKVVLRSNPCLWDLLQIIPPVLGY